MWITTLFLAGMVVQGLFLFYQMRRSGNPNTQRMLRSLSMFLNVTVGLILGGELVPAWLQQPGGLYSTLYYGFSSTKSSAVIRAADHPMAMVGLFGIVLPMNVLDSVLFWSQMSIGEKFHHIAAITGIVIAAVEPSTILFTHQVTVLSDLSAFPVYYFISDAGTTAYKRMATTGGGRKIGNTFGLELFICVWYISIRIIMTTLGYVIIKFVGFHPDASRSPLHFVQAFLPVPFFAYSVIASIKLIKRLKKRQMKRMSMLRFM